MYSYDALDHSVVRARCAEFRDQVNRRLSGALSEEEFRPLRLHNGLYLQVHAYMLRVAIPYGTLSARQLRRLARIARRYDRGYGHFTTRQNIQFNWISLAEAPDILDELADVEMHAIQTSGNLIRNVTTDAFAGAAADECVDPRPYGEVIRQWSTLHPEFSFLPRKFKIALTAAHEDRAAIRLHDIGLRIHQGGDGAISFEVFVGGGMGRTPRLGQRLNPKLNEGDLLSYLEAILRVYNERGRRDNKYRARIKILVGDMGIDAFRAAVDAEWEGLRDGALRLDAQTLAPFKAAFAPPAFLEPTAPLPGGPIHKSSAFAGWMRHNVRPHRAPAYASVVVSLKPEGGIPGDATAEQMERVADLAERYSFGEIRVSHEQNLVLPHVPRSALMQVWQELSAWNLATPNAGTLTDMIACPGLDYCAIANARSIPIAQDISRRFSRLDRLEDIGDLKVRISGCVNACGHHHVGHIGILGVDKRGQEAYQLMLGGSPGTDASLGQILGPALSADELGEAVEVVVGTYLGLRDPQEPFIDTVRRVGPTPFKEAVYGAH